MEVKIVQVNAYLFKKRISNQEPLDRLAKTTGFSATVVNSGFIPFVVDIPEVSIPRSAKAVCG